jgi:hypothetical protein
VIRSPSLSQKVDCNDYYYGTILASARWGIRLQDFSKIHRSVYVYNNYRKRIARVVRMGILYGAGLGARHMDHGISARHGMARPAAKAVPVVAGSWRACDFPDE